MLYEVITIASGHEHYWHLYIRSTKSKDPESYRGMFEWPELIYSKEIPVISEFLEGIITNNKAYHRHELVQLVADNLRLNTISNFEPLKRIPDFPPYYEGIHNRITSYNVCYTKLLRILSFKTQPCIAQELCS